LSKPPSNNSNNLTPWNLQQASELGGQVQELHNTLNRLKQESEDQIHRLQRESEDATKTIEKLQTQLQHQSDYELLKREVL
jgi:molecular chaperone GrpE (heat shock protein)